MGKYSGWIMLFAIAGTLSAVAAIAIAEAFVAATLLVLTVGEWELLAAIFYILASCSTSVRAGSARDGRRRSDAPAEAEGAPRGGNRPKSWTPQPDLQRRQKRKGHRGGVIAPKVDPPT